MLILLALLIFHTGNVPSAPTPAMSDYNEPASIQLTTDTTNLQPTAYTYQLQ